MTAVGQAGLLSGKRALILGVANDHSLAWGIARAFAAHGAELGFTYQGEGFERRVLPLAESVDGRFVVPADVQDPDSLDAVGGTAVYLASDLGACTTGEVIFVDGGFHVLGMAQPEYLE